MPLRVAIVYNQPDDKYLEIGEARAEYAVMGEVDAVRQSLSCPGYSVIQVPLKPPLESAAARLAALKEEGVDIVFNLFEGFGGAPETEAEVARIMEKLNLQFTGCPSAALELALDKVRAKNILKKVGIPVAEHQVLRPDSVGEFKLAFPCIVKPVAEDASHGLSADSVVHDIPALERQVQKISRHFGGRALVEEYLEGREFNTTVIGNIKARVLAVSEILYTLPADLPRILTFEAKWDENSPYYRCTSPVCPAVLTGDKQYEIARIARLAFRATGCRGYARVDFREDGKGYLRVLEVNPNPDISPDSGAARQAAAVGISYRQFIARIVRMAGRY